MPQGIQRLCAKRQSGFRLEWTDRPVAKGVDDKETNRPTGGMATAKMSDIHVKNICGYGKTFNWHERRGDHGKRDFADV